MKHVCLLLLPVALLTACGRTETATTTTTPSATATTGSAARAAERQNCRSVTKAADLGKPSVFKESAKPLTFTLTLEQDSSTLQTADGCYFNNIVTVLATKKAGKQAFKRTMLKDDLLYFTKDDELIRKSILQHAAYKATFNGERYFNMTMQLFEPVSKKTKNYLLFINYNGEILKIK